MVLSSSNDTKLAGTLSNTLVNVFLARNQIMAQQSANYLVACWRWHVGALISLAKSLNYTPTTNLLSICSRNHVYPVGMHVGWTNWLHMTLPLCTSLAKHMLLLTLCRAFLMARALQLPS